MEVIIIATKNCNHRPMLEKHLQALGISYEVQYIDENPELAQKFNVNQSPNLIVNDEVVFRPQPGKQLPSPTELENFLKRE
ncbi:MAG: thioredoxin family protein [Calditrichaeota bacterium]|nr:thioredoxin family protein [Calditrichota bacterium]